MIRGQVHHIYQHISQGINILTIIKPDYIQIRVTTIVIHYKK